LLGARRIVLAFDPTSDDPDLIRTVVMLHAPRHWRQPPPRGAHQLATTEEKITEAVAQLDKLDEVKKAAGTIHKNADKIESGCTAINSGIQRTLSDALAALADAKDAQDSPADAVA
jgi:hypothetical protein